MKLNTLEKSILIGVALAAAVTAICNADIGETYAKTCQEYGTPKGKHGNRIVWWINKDFTIDASFEDPNGRCDAIRYSNWSGPFEESQLSNLVARNVPKDDQFKEEPTNDASYRFWGSVKYHVAAVLQIGHGNGQRNPMDLTIMSDASLKRYQASHPSDQPETTTPVVAPPIDQLTNI